MYELVFRGQNDQALTSSLLVAEKFGKRHGDVVRAIENSLMKGSESTKAKLRSSIVLSSYVDEKGESRPMYVMNRDGFSVIAMGFTGDKAMDFKIEFVSAFNAMEKQLKEQQKPLSHLEILVQSAQALLDQSKRIDNVEKRLDTMEQEREENSRMLLSVTVSSEKVPQISMRDKVRQLVNRYAVASNIPQRDVWHKIYDQLYYLYHISVKAYKKEKKETYLDVAERNHFIDKMYTILSNLIRERNIA